MLLVLCVAPALISQAGAQTAPAGPAIKIVVLGDSLAAGLGVKPEQSFPARLEVALKAQGRNVAIVNQGVSGDTTAGELDRVDWLLGDKPDIVMIELGANDALRGTDPAVAEFFSYSNRHFHPPWGGCATVLPPSCWSEALGCLNCSQVIGHFDHRLSTLFRVPAAAVRWTR